MLSTFMFRVRCSKLIDLKQMQISKLEPRRANTFSDHCDGLNLTRITMAVSWSRLKIHSDAHRGHAPTAILIE